MDFVVLGIMRNLEWKKHSTGILLSIISLIGQAE